MSNQNLLTLDVKIVKIRGFFKKKILEFYRIFKKKSPKSKFFWNLRFFATLIVPTSMYTKNKIKFRNISAARFKITYITI